MTIIAIDNGVNSYTLAGQNEALFHFEKQSAQRDLRPETSLADVLAKPGALSQFDIPRESLALAA
jgi:hypothetical protein